MTYCSTALLTSAQIAAGAVSTVQCFDTFDESLRAIGVTPSSDPLRSTSAEATLNADGVIALHYDGDAGKGTALTIGGSDCNGGGVSFAAGSAWNDRIRSTAPKGCSKVKHWSEADYSGSVESVAGAQPVSLSGALAGRVSSIRYYA